MTPGKGRFWARWRRRLGVAASAVAALVLIVYAVLKTDPV